MYLKSSIKSVVLFLLSYAALLFCASLMPVWLRVFIVFPLVLYIPGALFLGLFRAEIKSIVRYIGYSFGISLFSVFIVATILNILVLAGLWAALTGLIFLFAQLILVASLVIVAYVQKKNLIITPKRSNADQLSNKIKFLGILLPMPVLAILGSIQLNNGGTNILAMLVPLYTIIIVIFIYMRSTKLPDWYLALSLLIIGISLSLQYSLRSNYLFGSDIHEEFMVFTQMLELGSWSTANSLSAYNSCFSITLLPTALKFLFGATPYVIFKLIMPIIISFIAFLSYSIARSFVNKNKAYIVAFFVISLPTFSQILTGHLRTGVAILFFALFIFTFFSKDISNRVRYILLIVFSSGIVLSHYSTIYLFLAFLLIWKFISIITKTNKDSILSWRLLLVIFVVSFLWLAQITNTGDNLRNFISISSNYMGEVFSQGSTSNQAKLSSQFGININKPTNYQEQLDKFASQTTNGTYSPGTLTTSPAPIEPYRFNQVVTNFIYITSSFISKLTKLIIIISPFIITWLVFIKKYRGNIKTDLLSSNFAALVIIGAVMIVPMASVSYSLVRVFQMMVIILAIPSVELLSLIFNKLKLPQLATLLPFIVIFLLYSGLLFSIFGGQGVYASLSNKGSDYERFYQHSSEYYAADWLSNNAESFKVISDESMYRKLQEKGTIKDLSSSMVVTPLPFSDASYIVAGRINKNGIAYTWVNNNSIRYNFPDFTIQKNNIYSSLKTDIYQ